MTKPAPTSGPASPATYRPVGARKPSRAASASPGHAPSADARHGYVKSFDGTKLFYSVEGAENPGTPLIFCYGLVCSSLHWTYQIDHFRRTRRAIWMDYRGHQNSEAPKDLRSLRVENLARDLAVVLDELQVEDAVLLGHSMGVNVVLDFYRQHPERVRAMVLANGTGSRPLENLFGSNAFQTAFRLLRRAHDRAPAWVEKVWRMQKGNPLARMLVALGGFNPLLTPAEDVQLYVDQVAQMDPAILVHLIENYDRYDAAAWLHTVRAPTLILAGEQDRMVPLAQQELLHQLIPTSELEVIRQGSHCPQMDLPDLVNQKIEAFLDRVLSQA